MGRFVSGIGIRILIVAVIAVGGFVLRDRLSGSAGDLKVGDCFDDAPGATVESVQHHPCTEAHDSEVVLVTKHPAAEGASFPTDAELDTYNENTCGNAAIGYMGGNAGANPSLVYAMFYPLEEDWKKGERRIVCYVTTNAGKTLTQSLKAATQ